MTTVSTEQVLNEFSSLLARVKDGETLLIEENGKPVGTLTPVQKQSSATDASRRIGFLVGKGNAPANWKEIAREEIEHEFYGEG